MCTAAVLAATARTCHALQVPAPPTEPAAAAATLTRLTAPIHATSLLTATGRGTMLLLIPLQGLELGGLMGGFSLPGMFALGAVVTNLPAAFAVTRFGHKSVMLAGLLLSAVSAVGVAFGPNLPAMNAAAFAFGLGTGVFAFGRLAYLSDMVPPAQRGRVVSGIAGSHRVGMFAGPAAGGALATVFDRPTALCAVGVCCALALCALWWWLPRGTTEPAAVPATPLSLVGRVIGAHRHAFATAGVAMLTLALVRNGRMLLIPICGTMLGLGDAELGLVKSVSMGVDMLLFYPAGVVMDRVGRKWTAAPCLALLSLGLWMIGTADSYSALLVGGVVCGFGNGLGSGINMALAGDLSPKAGRAEFLGVWGLTSDLGSAAAPFLMGLVAASLGLAGAAAAGAAIGLSGAALVIFGMRETRVRQG